MSFHRAARARHRYLGICHLDTSNLACRGCGNSRYRSEQTPFASDSGQSAGLSACPAWTYSGVPIKELDSRYIYALLPILSIATVQWRGLETFHRNNPPTLSKYSKVCWKRGDTCGSGGVATDGDPSSCTELPLQSRQFGGHQRFSMTAL